MSLMYSPAIVSTVSREPTFFSATSSPAESVASILMLTGFSMVTPVLPISSMKRLASTCCALSGSAFARALASRSRFLRAMAFVGSSSSALLVRLARFLDLAGLAQRLAEPVVCLGLVREDGDDRAVRGDGVVPAALHRELDSLLGADALYTRLVCCLISHVSSRGC